MGQMTSLTECAACIVEVLEYLWDNKLIFTTQEIIRLVPMFNSGPIDFADSQINDALNELLDEGIVEVSSLGESTTNYRFTDDYVNDLLRTKTIT